MEERAKVLQKRIISKFSESACGCGVVVLHFERLINTEAPQESRDSSFEFLRGFIWSMYYMGILKKHERSFMIDELIDLSESR